MKSQRILAMEKYILDHGTASMEELQKHFDVSMNTVRRDVSELLKGGSVRKVYGGVRAQTGEPALVPYEIRSIGDSQTKMLLARRAADFVHEGDVIFIDSGTTTQYLIDYLQDFRDLTIITNNVEIIMKALGHENIRLIVLPGQLRHKTRSITGEMTVSFLSRYNIRMAFMAATGVSALGVTNSSPLEYEIKKKAVENSENKVLMVTGGKFGITSLLTYARLDQFDAVVTDSSVTREYRELLAEKQVRLIVAHE